VVFDAFEELGDELFAHPWELGEVAGLCGRFERVDVADLARGPDQSYSLWAHARETKEFEHGGPIFLKEFFAKREGAGGKESLDVRDHPFAYTGDSEELLRVIGESGDLNSLLLDGFGRAAIGADAERVGAIDLEQSGSFVEKAGDRDIVHGLRKK
jgi:hypothetical protein